MATADPHLTRFAAFEELLYARRYSAVAFTHPLLAAWREETPLFSQLDGVQVVSSFKIDEWSVSRIALALPRNYFTKIDDSALAIGDGFVQEAYVAFRRSIQGTSRVEPTLVLLAPYVRLLNRLITRVGTVLGAPRLSFEVPDMNSVFTIFERSTVPGMAATRISVRDKREPAVELISLTGRNPLKSNLRAELRKVGPGYAIRVEVQTANGPVSVHLDRFGNYWWYHRADSNLTGPLSLVEALHGSAEINLDANRPTSRIANDD